MSLFGKMIPYRPDIKIPQEVKEFLEAAVIDAKGSSDVDPAHEKMLEALYQDLEVVMFFEDPSEKSTHASPDKGGKL